MIVQFSLSSHFRRPVVNIVHGGDTYPSLIDTGANIPVFTLGARRLADFDARLVGERAAFGGFGGGCTGALYRIDLDVGAFRYVDLPMICTHDPTMPFAFILSATMFTGFAYTIDDAARTLTVDTRTDETDLLFRIHDGAGGFRVLVGTKE